MIRSNGQFSSMKKKKYNDSLQKNWFKNRTTEEIDNAGDCPSRDSGQVSWNEGRRIVEIGFLSEALICQYCRELLHLKNIENEKRFGLASILDVKCQACNNICSVATGKRHNIDGSGAARCFDINTKLAAAIVNAGVGETQITNIFATLNIPSPTHSTIKKREREIGETLEKVATQSCKNAVCEEIAATNRNGKADATVLLDGGWQKRGSGNNHNSLSGHLTIIGKETKKCVDFGVAKKSCRICKFSKKKMKMAKTHECRQNFSGSSKAMESFLAVRGLKNLKRQGLNVKKVVMDDDSTTYVKIKNAVSNDIVKSSDKNHVTKGFTSDLYRLKEKNKNLTVSVINYLRKCFNYAVSQNKSNPSGMQSNITAIVPHSFGLHDACGDQGWCRFKMDRDYKHKSLPHGNDLVDESLKHDLTEMFAKYTTPAMCRKLADLESTNSVENLNQMISRKAPKAMHFSGSESLDFRVSAAVSQKNEGSSYICTVNEAHKMSPGKVTETRFQRLDKNREDRYRRQTSQEAKKRRLDLKFEKNVNQQFLENLEGISHKTGILTTDEINESATEVVPEPLLLNAEECRLQGMSTVVFDLETTGFGVDAHIIQLAALELKSGKTFGSYVFPPSGFIPKAVSKLTNIEIHANKMFYNSEYVASTVTRTALTNFTQFLAQFGKSVLVAHNVLFDSKILMNSCNKYGVDLSCVEGFGDTLLLFKSEYPERKKNGKSYKQRYLVNDILGMDYMAHSADEDVLALSKLLKTVENFEEKITTYSSNNIKTRLERGVNKKQNLNDYEEMLRKNVITKSRAELLASAGISTNHLKIIYNRSGYDGLYVLLRKLFLAPEKSTTGIAKYFEEMKGTPVHN